MGDAFSCFCVKLFGGGRASVGGYREVILVRLTMDKHKTRFQRSLTIIMQHFLDYSPGDALHKANKACTGGLLLP